MKSIESLSLSDQKSETVSAIKTPTKQKPKAVALVDSGERDDWEELADELETELPQDSVVLSEGNLVSTNSFLFDIYDIVVDLWTCS